MRRRGVVFGLAGGPLVGCGRKPTKVVDVSPAISARVSVVAGGGGPLVYVDRPRVADAFDHTQTNASEPSAGEIQRAMVDDLAVRFGMDRVMATPIQRYATPDWRVSFDVLRFDVDEAGRAALDARWTLLAGADERLAATRRERIEASAGGGADSQHRVVALRAAVAILANRIADAMATPR